MSYSLPLCALSALIAFGLSGTTALAEGDRAVLKQRCGGDYATFCGDLPPDGPEVQACFRKNMSSLSPACRAEIDRHEKGGKKV
ncbi:hypothetical protein [Methylorubrum extorquens]|uniref:hypothetical protein n=1 Tax=Methylorubrum extorquens TaxID=408 RepID=UPI0002E479CA|nr:hypothetical protein [Methylorubrum extorquens]WIU41586.1 hypothetical protein KQ926_09930 [Methylorubrum extorquens]